MQHEMLSKQNAELHAQLLVRMLCMGLPVGRIPGPNTLLPLLLVSHASGWRGRGSRSCSPSCLRRARLDMLSCVHMQLTRRQAGHGGTA